jgi:hypothetical protein
VEVFICGSADKWLKKTRIIYLAVSKQNARFMGIQSDPLNHFALSGDN